MVKKPSECGSFVHTGALSVILYFPVVLLEVIISSTQIAMIFSNQPISEWLYNLFLVVKQTGRISLTSLKLVIYNVTCDLIVLLDWSCV